MHVHVVALADIPVQRETPCCAFTTKAFHLTKMLRMRGHQVTLYGCAGTDETVADETVICVPEELVKAAHLGANWDYDQISTDNRNVAYDEFCNRVRYEIPRHSAYGKTEPVCLVVGWADKAVKNLHPQNPVIESGIGYPFTMGTKYRVFESHSWRSWHWGGELHGGWRSESPFDVVIPNAFDPDMFDATMERENYGLFMGRVNEDKGWRLAMRACHAVGLPLKIVGQLPAGNFNREAFFNEVGRHGATWEGRAGIERRKELMGHARVFFCPTQYNEPFGGVAVEAMLAGCPVITSDWGAFPETVIHGITGFRCYCPNGSHREIVEAIKAIGSFNPAAIRAYAEANYSLERVSHMYDAYLENVVADVEKREPAKSMLGIPLRFPVGFNAPAQKQEGGPND